MPTHRMDDAFDFDAAGFAAPADWARLRDLVPKSVPIEKVNGAGRLFRRRCPAPLRLRSAPVSRLAADLEPGDSVKALSLWEPWASLMATGAKTIETRHWRTAYRGPLLICASARRVKGELCRLLDDKGFQIGLRDLSPGDTAARPDDLNFGHAVAIVELTACLKTEALRTDSWLGSDGLFGNYSDGRFGWVMSRRVRRLRPFPVRGRQGLFTVQLPADLRDWR